MSMSNQRERYDAEGILSSLCLRTCPAKKGLLAYQPPIDPEEMEPVGVWFFMNGASEPDPGPHTMPCPPHAPQPNELWVKGQKGPRKAAMGIFVGYCALDYESHQARAENQQPNLEDLPSFKAKYNKAKALCKRNVSIGDNVARAGAECLPLIDIPNDRLYRVVAKCPMKMSNNITPTSYFVLAKPDENGICEGFKPKGVVRSAVFWLPYFRDDFASTGNHDRSEVQKTRLVARRRELLGLEARAIGAPTGLPEGFKSEPEIEEEGVPAVPQPAAQRTPAILESIEVDPPSPIAPARPREAAQAMSVAPEAPVNKRKRQGEDEDFYKICSGQYGNAGVPAKQILESWIGFIREHPDVTLIIGNFSADDIQEMVSAFVNTGVLRDYRLLRPCVVSYAKVRRDISRNDPFDADQLARSSAKEVADLIGSAETMSKSNRSDASVIRDLLPKIQPQIHAVDNYLDGFANSLGHMKSYVIKGEQRLAHARREHTRLQESLDSLAQRDADQ